MPRGKPIPGLLCSRTCAYCRKEKLPWTNKKRVCPACAEILRLKEGQTGLLPVTVLPPGVTEGAYEFWNELRLECALFKGDSNNEGAD